MAEILHASCVAVGGRGLLILGPSGAGKSTLALEMIALGASLVSDDRTEVTREGESLAARAPATLQGLIEARHIGILRLEFQPEVALSLAVDLGQTESARLPPQRHVPVQGLPLPLVLGPLQRHLASALMCLLKGSRFA